MTLAPILIYWLGNFTVYSYKNWKLLFFEIISFWESGLKISLSIFNSLHASYNSFVFIALYVNIRLNVFILTLKHFYYHLWLFHRIRLYLWLISIYNIGNTSLFSFYFKFIRDFVFVHIKKLLLIDWLKFFICKA